MGEWGETTHSNGCKRIRRSCFNVSMTPFPGSAEPPIEPTNTSSPDGIRRPDSTSNTSHSNSSFSASHSSSIFRSGSISRPDGDPLLAILPTAADADRVAVVMDGRVVELGSHDQLVALGGHYASLWRSWQSG